MKPFLLSQDEVGGYDTYDSMVVKAESEHDARLMRPDHSCEWGYAYGAWASAPDSVKVEFLGDYLGDDPSPGVVCASFNAG